MKDLVTVCNRLVRWSYSPVRTRRQDETPEEDTPLRIFCTRYKSKSQKKFSEQFLSQKILKYFFIIIINIIIFFGLTTINK